ncbi:MAG: kinase/pyrophosphorylase [Bacteroidetes bacterium]|nr:kinase/pyrophosphorylase [Bacteroidota bacterium]MBL6943372.1 kinase/pyrophosphorylase [Bacteroidales bacterium]
MIQHIFIVSDGTGGTASHALKAALVQFEGIEVETYIRPVVRTKKQVLDVISEAHHIKGMIVHTMVSKKLRNLMLEQGRLHDLRTIDLMGPLLAQLSHHFADFPAEKPGIFHLLNKAYFQRIEAVEFTLRHDDGQRVDELHRADIVLLGVSRTFKTPLSVYMAYKGWLVANVPIILGMDVPDIIYKLPPDKVFCLTTFPNRLVQLRKIRDNYLGNSTGNYSDRAHIQKELNYASRIYKMQPKWSIINVTNKPIEEISSEILSILRKK